MAACLFQPFVRQKLMLLSFSESEILAGIGAVLVDQTEAQIEV